MNTPSSDKLAHSDPIASKNEVKEILQIGMKVSKPMIEVEIEDFTSLTDPKLPIGHRKHHLTSVDDLRLILMQTD